MYGGKFNEIYVCSPSYAKMGFKVKTGNATTNFNLEWIFNKIEDVNRK